MVSRTLDAKELWPSWIMMMAGPQVRKREIVLAILVKGKKERRRRYHGREAHASNGNPPTFSCYYRYGLDAASSDLQTFLPLIFEEEGPRYSQPISPISADASGSGRTSTVEAIPTGPATPWKRCCSWQPASAHPSSPSSAWDGPPPLPGGVWYQVPVRGRSPEMAVRS